MITIKLNKKQQLKQSKGITLIALVITIIVLLILAGVSIATLTGKNGILTQANDAKTENVKGKEKEAIGLAYNSVKIDKVSTNDKSKITDDELKAALEKDGEKVNSVEEDAEGTITVIMLTGNKYTITQAGEVKYVETGKVESSNAIEKARKEGKPFDNNTTLTDTYGNSVTVPAGFKIASDSATEVTGGVVIEDATYSRTLGSQFVWVPVGDVNTATGTETIILGRYEFDSTTGEPSALPEDYYYVEENSKDTENLLNYGNAIAKDIEAFKASTGANKNGGYYIGRYEAGVIGYDSVSTSNSSSLPSWTGYTKNNGTSPQIVCKQAQQVWNYITQNKASEVSKDMYEDTLPFTSDLINSYAWDTAIVFIQTFGEEDNSLKYSWQVGESTDITKPSLTGSGILRTTNKLDKQCNIFDMAGNCCEWTTETFKNNYKYPCTHSGGDYSDNNYSTNLRQRH